MEIQKSIEVYPPIKIMCPKAEFQNEGLQSDNEF